jgi:linoleoyl-CoA desaturase
MKKIKFAKGSSSLFFQSVNEKVEKQIITTGLLQKAKKLLWRKMAFYFLLHAASYILLLSVHYQKPAGLILNFIFIGLSGILVAFNVSHDACHGAFSRDKRINYWLYHLSFNLQGPNAYLWRLRHIASHHVFPNVDGCDADIDDNPLIRLSPQHPLRRYQRFQHIYSVFVYCAYTLHWFLFKDVLYLFKKKLANLVNKKHPPKEWFLFMFWKITYLFLLLAVPFLSGYPVGTILLSFLIMHIINSLFFIHVLIATHFCMETEFPKPDRGGILPGDYYVHQLATSLDYSPSSKLYNWIFGGFNAHAAHHLYPKLPHTSYPAISMIIEETAGEFNVRYNKLSLGKAIRSHYKYLRMMGNPGNSRQHQSDKETAKHGVKHHFCNNCKKACPLRQQ